MMRKSRGVICGLSGLLLLCAIPSWSTTASKTSSKTSGTTPTCSTTDGAPALQTANPPVTVPPVCKQGRRLSFEQDGIRRYACLNLPPQAQGAAAPAGAKWPLLIYLHGSRTTPDSLYVEGKSLFALHNQYPLSKDPAVKGFILLAPEGRRMVPWAAPDFQTGTGFHWDEWYRNSTENLDAKAVDHFLDEVIATGKVDPRQIYVFGWSNGAYMAALYGVWRGDRIAAIGQYAGGDPWSRPPCPVDFTYTRKVPLFLMRNLCDAAVSCSTTSSWITTLQQADWPFEYRSLALRGNAVSPDSACASSCSTRQGAYEHIRWPQTAVLSEMLDFLKQHPLP